MCTIPTPLHRAGVDLRTAQHLLDRATIQVTAEIYIHMEAEESLKAVHHIDEYLQKSTS